MNIKKRSVNNENHIFRPSGVDRSNIDEFLAFDKIAAIGGSFFVKEALEKTEEKKNG